MINSNPTPARQRNRVVGFADLLCAGMAAVLMYSASVTTAQTPPTTVTNTFNVNKAIPPGSANGVSDTQVLDFHSQQLFSITDLQVTLNISGGFSGDYYATLVHNGGFAVLLNRPGRTSSNPVGYTDTNLNLTLSDSSPNDIHTYQLVVNPGGGTLTGTWAPDGRNVDPANVVDTDNRTAFLSSFNTEDPDGQWTLLVASLDFGEQGQLVSWGLVVSAIPEPNSSALLIFGGVFVAMAGLRTRWAAFPMLSGRRKRTAK